MLAIEWARLCGRIKNKFFGCSSIRHSNTWSSVLSITLKFSLNYLKLSYMLSNTTLSPPAKQTWGLIQSIQPESSFPSGSKDWQQVLYIKDEKNLWTQKHHWYIILTLLYEYTEDLTRIYTEGIRINSLDRNNHIQITFLFRTPGFP